MGDLIRTTLEVWRNEGFGHYGKSPMDWEFRCVSCGETQTGREFVEAGVEPKEAMTRAYFSCIGRVVNGRGCDWSLGGLLRIHTKEVQDQDGNPVAVFRFGFEETPG